jgi:hypothetical protein
VPVAQFEIHGNIFHLHTPFAIMFQAIKKSASRTAHTDTTSNYRCYIPTVCSYNVPVRWPSLVALSSNPVVLTDDRLDSMVTRLPLTATTERDSRGASIAIIALSIYTRLAGVGHAISSKQ